MAIAVPAAIAPAAASAAATLTITPSNLQAGGHPDLAIAVSNISPYALGQTGGFPTSLAVTLPPGALANANAAPSCLTGSPNLTSACQVATGTVTAAAGTYNVAGYMVPPPNSSDVAGFTAAVTTTGGAPIAALPGGEVKVITNSSGQPVLQLSVNVTPAAALGITAVTLNVGGTLNNVPFTRMPTSCAGVTGSLAIAYSTGGAETDTTNTITPTGCSSLTYAPTITESGVRDASDSGVALTAEVKQSPLSTESASKAATISFPSVVLAINVTSALAALNSCPTIKAGCTQIGTASITSPLFPVPLTGALYVDGTITAPYLSVVLPAPFAFTLNGAISLSSQSVTFGAATTAFPNETPIPDVPISDLKVSASGGASSLFNATCSPASAQAPASFTSQIGTTVSLSPTLSVTGCPATTVGPTIGAPTASGASLTGLVSGKATLKFRLAAGKNAPLIKSFKVSLPKGLKFISKGLKKGLKVSGKYTAKISGRALVVTLKTAASSVSVKVSSKALSVSKSLSTSVKKKKTKSLSSTVKVTDAKGTTTSLTLSFTKLK